jgi:hypothetical protein
MGRLYLLYPGPWKAVDEVEYATLEWVDWFNNRRLLEPIGNIPPAEFEKHYDVSKLKGQPRWFDSNKTASGIPRAVHSDVNYKPDFVISTKGRDLLRCTKNLMGNINCSMHRALA